MDPIALSDDDSNASDVIDLGDESNDDVIEICEIRDDCNDKYNAQYDYIVKECKILGEFIEKCLDLENTKGMIRVINRSLIPTYYSTTERFRRSDVLTTVLLRAIRKLDSDPDHKFSHVKQLCYELKKQSQKLEEKAMRQRAMLLRQKNAQKRAKKRIIEEKKIGAYRKTRKLNGMEHIVLSDDDDSDSFEVPIINLEEHASESSINDVPYINEERVKEEELIEIEIESINKEIELSHNDKIASRTYCSILNIGSDKQSVQNSDDIHNTIENKLSDDDTKLYSNEAHLSSTTHEISIRTNNTAESLPQDNNFNLLRSNPKGCGDEEVSSTEISSTVPEDDCIRGSQDSDLIVLDEVNNDLQTTAQEVSKDSHFVKSDENIPVIFVDKSSEQMEKKLIVLDEENETVTTTQDINQDSIKEAPKVDSVQNSKLIRNNDLIVIDDEDDLDSNAHNNNSISVANSLLISDEDKLLVPHKAEVFEGTTEDQLMLKIKRIEADIAACKAKVTELEEQEVVNDSMWSPYIQCEKYKEKIVHLYKELCKLTGERAVKRREVRLKLKADNMRSQMCVEKLENFINSNIGPDGFPHFPDFQDVLACVRKANKEGDLGWSRSIVMREANALFTYCGRALQESRKRREWRDMLCLVKSEAIEDPADNDPELMARLQANRQTAVKKENDLLERYTEMTYLQLSTECTKENDTYESDSENDTENEEDIDDTSTLDTVRNTTSQLGQNNNVNENSTNKFKSLEVMAQKLVDAVYNEPNINSVQKQDVKTQVARKRCTLIKLDADRSYRHAMNQDKAEIPPDIDHTNILNHNFELIPKVVVQKLDLPVVPGVKFDIRAAQIDDITLDPAVVIKTEALDDIQEKLNNLGTDFTATVIDIQDPFLVVEISSDSEDDDYFTGIAEHFL